MQDCVKVHQDSRYLLPAVTSDDPSYKERQMFTILKSLARQLNTDSEAFVLISSDDGASIDLSSDDSGGGHLAGVLQEEKEAAEEENEEKESSAESDNDDEKRAVMEGPLPSQKSMDDEFESLMPSLEDMARLEFEAEGKVREGEERKKLAKGSFQERLALAGGDGNGSGEDGGDDGGDELLLEDTTSGEVLLPPPSLLLEREDDDDEPRESPEATAARARARRRREYTEVLLRRRHEPTARLALRELKRPRQMAKQVGTI